MILYSFKKFLRQKKNNLYQDKLIIRLNKEHRHLVSLALRIEEAVKNNDLKLFKSLLRKFEKELELHLLYEDTNLYEHLNSKYRFFDEVKNLISKKQNEMKDIASCVSSFIERYKKSENLENFLKEFSNIKEILLKRIEFEENILYDIYKNSYTPNKVLIKLKFN